MNCGYKMFCSPKKIATVAVHSRNASATLLEGFPLHDPYTETQSAPTAYVPSRKGKIQAMRIPGCAMTLGR